MEIKSAIKTVKWFILSSIKYEKIKFSICLIAIISFFISIFFLKLSIIKLCAIFFISFFILIYALFKATEIDFIKKMIQLDYVRISHQIATSENPPSQKEVETMVDEFFKEHSNRTWILKKAILGNVNILHSALQNIVERRNESILNQNEVEYLKKFVVEELKTSKKFRSENEK